MYYEGPYNRDDMWWFYVHATSRIKQGCKTAIERRSIGAWLCFKQAQLYLWMMKVVNGICIIFREPVYNHTARKYREICERIDDIFNNLKEES